MKYIMLETAEGAKLPVIFSDQFVHHNVASVMVTVCKVAMKQEATVVSAGFVGLGTNVTVSGESESLGGMKCVESDAARIMVGDSVMFMPDALAMMLMGQLDQHKVKLNDNGWHLPSVNEGLRVARLCNGHPMPGDEGAGEGNWSPTDDAYMRACRAAHWHVAQLRAHGIEPDPIAPDSPQYPLDDHVFSTVPS